MLTNDFIDTIKNALAKLKSQEIHEIGRAANMLWIGFGKDIAYINFKGKPAVKSEYALHIQCNWEIISGNEIILSQEDFYVPRDEESIQLFEVESFGNSKFDKVAVDFNATIKTNPTYVNDFDVHITGVVELKLSNDLIIRVYTDGPSERESWRLLLPHPDEEHFVVFED